MKINHNYFDVYYNQSECPTFCYRSGNMVYEEMLLNGVLVSNGWNGAGYPLDLLACMPTRLDQRYYTEPSAFNIELDGQSVDYELNFVDFKTEKDENRVKAVLTLESRVKPVIIRVITELDGTQMFTRYCEIENKSESNMNLSRLSLISGGVEEMETEKLTASHDIEKFYSVGYFADDRWGNEGKFTWKDLKAEVTSVDTRFNRDRFRHPLVMIRNNLMGKIWFAQTAWSGGCRFTVDYNAKPEVTDTYLSFKAEILSHNPMYIIAPGETFVTPEVHIGMVCGDFDDAVYEMHSHIRKSVLNRPEADGSQLLVGAGMGAEHDMSVETSKVYIDRMYEMGGEVFIVDAGWECPPGRQTEWGDFTGTNIPDPDRYPNGIKELSDYCHKKGMKFGLWSDIESLGKLCSAYTEHPEWRAGNIYGTRSNRLIDLTVPEAAKMVENELARFIEEYEIDLLRIDYNTDFREYFNLRDTGKGTKECLSIRHFKEVYRIYSNLKARFPDVVFENCAGGGGRTDLGMMKAFNHTWVSDNQCVPSSVMITNGMTVALPPERVDRLFAGMNCHNFGSFDLQMRNAMLTHMSINVISPVTAEMNELQLDFVKHSIRLYKEFIRPFMPTAKTYHHTPDTVDTFENGFSALEIVSPDCERGALAAFNLCGTNESVRKIRLKGVDATKNYEVIFDNDNEKVVVSGRELKYEGINIYISSSLSSELVLYKAI
ncbi:MAG: alpha-galactosidase [Acutalibacteraceae bacterium]|nr:alpha-galactosidase [Acutalibacteraceae bacterium]